MGRYLAQRRGPAKLTPTTCGEAPLLLQALAQLHNRALSGAATEGKVAVMETKVASMKAKEAAVMQKMMMVTSPLRVQIC